MTALFISSVVIFAQNPEDAIKWKISSTKISGSEYELLITGDIDDGWHTYSLTNETSPTTVAFVKSSDFELVGSPYEKTKWIKEKDNEVFYNQMLIGQKVRILGNEPVKINATVEWMGCTDEVCSMPIETELSITVGQKNEGAGAEISDNKNVSDTNNTVISSDNQQNEHQSSINDPTKEEMSSNAEGTSIWALIIEAILWGFAMMLTPCVFPMVPMTISFFMKNSSSQAAGKFKASMYGLFIVLLYTVPICVIIGLTWLLGGETVTADIFNWLSTHWLPNIIFFIVFMIFAASFFGAFEITMPSSLIDKTDRNADKKGLAGVFFMALTLVLVSFSCTGPIVGSVLIKSTQGQFWTPVITMLAFSVAFALPFTLVALFPSLLNKVKKGSGPWLGSVKVVLGFVELALGLKFLSVPDQTYHWGLLDREVYLAIWIVIFSLMGLYLLGKIKFDKDEVVEKLGIFRLSLVIAIFSFVVYLIPGMFGAPLKALSGYLPPIESQDFVLGSNTSSVVVTDKGDHKSGLKLPLGLTGYFNLEDGLKAAKEQGKPLFVDITGHGCTNCREMEQRVWSDPRVLEMLRNDFVMTALYTDDKTRLDEKDWLTAENGKVLKDMGRVNSYIVRTKFGVNAQPNYAILAPDGTLLVPIRGYNLDIDAYIAFLQSGIDKYKEHISK